ncbi:DDE-type integrase/transposase/recombinase [Ensifer sp. ENS04]|uniref:Mu transposase C-terminal domain-containing protein n=1 Tax=Ensifer sp. ENS04 TaxID=2769281 RepID=UPI001784B070|nr:Mu transposase C-terminal domain-containing protein [Ensifer sp. ENS04]MBD9538938.1 DDE-type integrase/transposase/recombinase [Ensifer sp. ENS04]
MNVHKLPASDQYTRIGIKKDDRILFKGGYFTLHSEIENGVLLAPIVEDGKPPREFQPLHWHQISLYVRARVLEVEKGYFGAASAIKRAQRAKIFDLPPDVILRARMCAEFLAAAEDVYETGEIYTRSDASIAKFLAKFEAENSAMVAETRGGKTAKAYRDKTLVGPRQFRRLLNIFEENHFEPASLLPRYKGHAAVGSKFDTSLQYIMKFARLYHSSDRPTMKDCYAQMVKDNGERKELGQTTVEIPSLRTFQRMIRELGDLKNESGRSTNEARIQRKNIFGKKGLKVTRPLEIVEMDEHEIDLVRILNKNGIWKFLHQDVQKRVSEKSRAWLSVALDAYSRSICGMRLLYDAPDGNSGVATLAMVARVKDAETALHGTTSPWPQGGTPEAIHTDAGAAYVSAAFQAAAMALTGRHVIPPSKHPHLRARVERFFRTLNQRYIHLFSGRTFSNVLLRDEYDSEKHAHINHDELSDLLCRLIVDCYHNTVQRGLYGLTPLQAWYRGSQLEGAVEAHPSADEYRDIFAITDTRRLGNYGIEILGNRYSNEDLQAIRKHNYNARLVIRINDQDISKISVKDRYVNKWITVPAVFDGLKNVTLFEWMETIRYINQHFSARSAHSQTLVNRTLSEVRSASDLSKESAGIGSPLTDASVIRRFEKKEMGSFAYSQPQNVDFGDEDESAGNDEGNWDAEADDAFSPPEGEFEPIAAEDTGREARPKGQSKTRKNKPRKNTSLSQQKPEGAGSSGSSSADTSGFPASEGDDDDEIELSTDGLNFKERSATK